MQQIDLVQEQLNGILAHLPDIRRQALKEAGEKTLALVRSRIGGRGKVQSWQEMRMGSGGGYSAVRPKARTHDNRGYSVGYVTNAIESGHPASGWASGGRDSVGKRMYANTAQDAERLAMQVIQRIEQDMEARMQ